MTDDESQDIEERRQQLADVEREAQDRLTAARCCSQGLQRGAPPGIGCGSLTRSPHCHGKESDAVGLTGDTAEKSEGKGVKSAVRRLTLGRTGSLGARSSTLPSSAHF